MLLITDENEKQFYQNLRAAEDDSWFTMAKEMAASVDVEPSKPRTIGRLTTRPNAPACSVKEYFYRNSYIPMLDHIISELNSQFGGE